ncbi:hypothetical protein QR685DRAFT_432026, partial [Neurospora intermedia]
EDRIIVFSKAGYPFFIKDRGITINNLYIPYKFIKEVLEAAYNKKYYFGYN